jgi:hypothetical protein
LIFWANGADAFAVAFFKCRRFAFHAYGRIFVVSGLFGAKIVWANAYPVGVAYGTVFTFWYAFAGAGYCDDFVRGFVARAALAVLNWRIRRADAETVVVAYSVFAWILFIAFFKAHAVYKFMRIFRTAAFAGLVVSNYLRWVFTLWTNFARICRCSRTHMRLAVVFVTAISVDFFLRSVNVARLALARYRVN